MAKRASDPHRKVSKKKKQQEHNEAKYLQKLKEYQNSGDFTLACYELLEQMTQKTIAQQDYMSEFTNPKKSYMKIAKIMMLNQYEILQFYAIIRGTKWQFFQEKKIDRDFKSFLDKSLKNFAGLNEKESIQKKRIELFLLIIACHVKSSLNPKREAKIFEWKIGELIKGRNIKMLGKIFQSMKEFYPLKTDEVFNVMSKIEEARLQRRIELMDKKTMTWKQKVQLIVSKKSKKGNWQQIKQPPPPQKVIQKLPERVDFSQKYLKHHSISSFREKSYQPEHSLPGWQDNFSVGPYINNEKLNENKSRRNPEEEEIDNQIRKNSKIKGELIKHVKMRDIPLMKRQSRSGQFSLDSQSDNMISLSNRSLWKKKASKDQNFFLKPEKEAQQDDDAQ